MFHYVYRITNRKENKHYYGVRSSKVEPKLDLGIKYFSSSTDKIFIKLQKENKNDFKYKILKLHSLRKSAVEHEIKLHHKFNVSSNDLFYNKSKQTSKSFDTTGTTHERNKGINNPMFGLKRIDHSKSMKGIKNHFFNKKHSDFTKNNISEKTKNKVVCKNKITGEMLKVSKEIFDNDENLVGCTSNYKVSEETKLKISKSSKGIKKNFKKFECVYCKKLINSNVINRYHNENCKLKEINEKNTSHF